jgi:LysR family nitrogen assimilation transcriptional regulator
MDLVQLRNFLTVVEQRSISNAAIVLGIAQPALSRQLQMLEKSLGTALLVRHRRGVDPTPAGELAATHARGLLSCERAFRDEINAIASTPTGPLAVGVSSSLAQIMLPAIAINGKQDLPDVQLKLLEASSLALQERLHTQEIDLAVLQGVGAATTLASRVLFTEELVAVGAPGVFDPNVEATIDEVLERQVITTPLSSKFRHVCEQAAERRNVSTTIMELDSFSALLKLLATGAGVTFLPYATIHDHVEQGMLSWATVAGHSLTRRIYISRLKTRPVSPAMKRVEAIILKFISDNRATLRWSVGARLA